MTLVTAVGTAVDQTVISARRTFSGVIVVNAISTGPAGSAGIAAGTRIGIIGKQR
jgi:hypothetical protein